MRMPTISLLFILFAQSASAADWWTSHTGAWCLRSGAGELCLPDGFRVVEVTEEQINFRRDDELNPARFVEYYYRKKNYKRPDSGNSYTFQGSRSLGDVTVFSYQSKTTASVSDVTYLYVIETTASALVVFGSESEQLSAMAFDLAEQLKE